MKQTLFLLLFLFIAVLVNNAQTNGSVSKLKPIAPHLGKFSKNAVRGNGKVKFTSKTEAIRLPDGKTGISVVIQIPYNEIVFVYLGKQTAKVSFYGRITSKSKKVDGFFEEKLVLEVDTEDLLDVTGKNVTLRKVFELPEEKYQIGIIVRDITSGARSAKVIKFQIP